MAPTALLPADLGAVVRIDVEQMQAQLGPELTQRLLVDGLDGGEEEPGRAWLEAVVERAERIWLGLQLAAPDSGPEVMLSRGRFSSVFEELSGAEHPWFASAAGAGPAHYWREAASGGWVHAYPIGDELLAWATASGASKLEQHLASSAVGAAPAAPERGTLSAAAAPDRLRRLFRARYPELAGRFAGAEDAAAYVDMVGRGLSAELTLGFAAPKQADDAAQLIGRLLSQLSLDACAGGVLARSGQVSVFDRRLRVRARLEPAEANGLWTCILEGACCAERSGGPS